jgi:glutamate synthase (NADPH/NADH) small chain
MIETENIQARRNEPWREELRKSLKAKERSAISRVHMPELPANYRNTKLKEEVNQGLTQEQAVAEAQRCLDCPTPTCMNGCPVQINIPTFVKNIERARRKNNAKASVYTP